MSGLVRPGSAAAQVEVDWGQTGARRGRLRLRTLVNLRWLIIGLEAAMLALAAGGLARSVPLAPCLALVGLSAAFALAAESAARRRRLCSDTEAGAHLAADIAQISLFAYLTGGAANPFILVMLAPIALAAATLRLRPVLLLSGLGAAASAALAFLAWPPGSFAPDTLAARLVAAGVNIAGIALVSGFVRQATTESARMALALDVTQAVLAREQKLSALGALAAAAAHELGTPLATISIVAKELAREAATPALKEDADLLIAQAERCRGILKRLTDSPETTDQMHERMSLRQLVQEVIEPHAGARGVRVEAIVAGSAGARSPDVRRSPEILHSMSTFVENALDFADSEVLLTARFDAAGVSMEVRDDGPGFAPDILARLGEPYLTSRPDAEGSRTGHVGMGLGFFIAKTLLERTGGAVSARNLKPRGAMVLVRWPRERIEARTG